MYKGYKRDTINSLSYLNVSKQILESALEESFHKQCL